MSIDPAIAAIESLFYHLRHEHQVETLRRLLPIPTVCPRCLESYRYEEEKKAKLCSKCVLSFAEAIVKEIP